MIPSISTYNSGKFPNYAIRGRDPELYPKKKEEIITTAGWADAKDDITTIVEQVVDILTEDGAFENIVVDTDVIVTRVINTLKAQGFGSIDEDKLKKDVATDVIAALKEDEDFLASLKGDPGDPGKDGEDGPTTNEVVNALKADNDFLTSVKGDPGDPGKDGKDGATAAEVITDLKTDEDFSAAIENKIIEIMESEDFFIQGIL